MYFSVGVELPGNADQAFGLIVPALCNGDYYCLSTADSKEDIAPMIREAILLVLEDMILSGKYSKDAINDAGYLTYCADEQYKDYTSWFVIEIDLSQFEGKSQRINISLPDTLIKRIDCRVKTDPTYRDRSHFIAEAARHELTL